MTSAYIIELTSENVKTVAYLRRGGSTSTLPYFWGRSYDVVNAVNRQLKYRITHPRAGISVIVVQNLEKGLRDSTATKYSFDEFVNRLQQTKNTAACTYKLQLYPKVFVGAGKYGKTWSRSADLRNFLTRNISALSDVYKGATVVIIETAEDGVTQKSVTRVPVLDWYCEKQKFKDLYQKSLVKTMPNQAGNAGQVGSASHKDDTRFTRWDAPAQSLAKTSPYA